MPTITIGDRKINCAPGSNLRRVLLDHNIELYNGNAKIINCMGIGSCGTCAVELKGKVRDRNWKEKARLNFPPHKADKPLRLACQIEVNHDLEITKYEGFWGHKESLNHDFG